MTKVKMPLKFICIGFLIMFQILGGYSAPFTCPEGLRVIMKQGYEGREVTKKDLKMWKKLMSCVQENHPDLTELPTMRLVNHCCTKSIKFSTFKCKKTTVQFMSCMLEERRDLRLIWKDPSGKNKVISNNPYSYPQNPPPQSASYHPQAPSPMSPGFFQSNMNGAAPVLYLNQGQISPPGSLVYPQTYIAAPDATYTQRIYDPTGLTILAAQPTTPSVSFVSKSGIPYVSVQSHDFPGSFVGQKVRPVMTALSNKPSYVLVPNNAMRIYSAEPNTRPVALLNKKGEYVISSILNRPSVSLVSHDVLPVVSVQSNSPDIALVSQEDSLADLDSLDEPLTYHSKNKNPEKSSALKQKRESSKDEDDLFGED